MAYTYVSMMAIIRNIEIAMATVTKEGAFIRSENVKYSTIMQGIIKSSVPAKFSSLILISFGYISKNIVGIRLADILSSRAQNGNPFPVRKNEIIGIHVYDAIHINHAVAVTAQELRVIFQHGREIDVYKRQIWMWVIYLMLTVASTCSNMPYGALNGCITPDTEDRAKVSGLRMMFANVSSMVTVIIAVPLIRAFATDGSATDARGYFFAVLITCLLGIPTMIICCFKTKEVVTPPPSQESIPIKAQLKSLVKNKPVIILIVGQLILGCVIYGRAAMLAYYWQYNAGDAGYATTYGWVSLVAAVVGTGWLGNFLFRIIKHKGKVCAVLNFMTAAAYFLMYFVTAPAMTFWILTFIGSMSFYAYMGIHFGAIGDAVDYGEYVSGVRCDGFLSSIVSVANKAGGAIMPAVGAAVLAALNYTAGGSQSPEVLNAINWFITLIPAIISVANGVFYLMYPISTEEHKKIMGELIRRREVNV